MTESTRQTLFSQRFFTRVLGSGMAWSRARTTLVVSLWASSLWAQPAPSATGSAPPEPPEPPEETPPENTEQSAPRSTPLKLKKELDADPGSAPAAAAKRRDQPDPIVETVPPYSAPSDAPPDAKEQDVLGDRGAPVVPREDGKATVSEKPGEAPTVARPQAQLPPLRSFFLVGLSVDTHWNKDPSYDFVSPNDVRGQAGLNVLVDVLRHRQWVLSVGFDYLGGSRDAENPPADSFVLSNRIDTTSLGGQAMLRYHLAEWFAPHVRVGVGGTAIESYVDTTAGRASIDQIDPYGTLTAGFSVFSRKFRTSNRRTWANAVSAVGIVEAGIAGQPALDYTIAERDASTDDGRPIVTAETALGTLDMTGAYLRVGILAHF